MKILKYLIGLVTAIGGVLALFGGSKNKKVKQLNKKVNQSKKVVKNKKKEIKKVNDILTDKKKKAGKLKNKRKNYKKKEVSTKEASDFLKQYAKKGKK
jgi:oligoribonuclease (3'-5' exoribonuclease)|tara:strand:+ start:115 stop:408 length:294 start_codon:yes stop_codon:yes gene_type:complete